MSEESESPTQGQTEQDESADSSGAAVDLTLYRVNRLGREIFVGNKTILITAIQTRRVRGDDLIFDEGSDTWGFARKHPVFLEATGQSVEDIERRRTKESKWVRWIRFLINAGIIGFLLYLVVGYSKTIEFKLGDGDGSLQNLSGNLGPKSDAKGEGSGEGSGDGSGDGADEQGYAELNALLKKEEEDSLGTGQTIEQIFDLSEEGVLDNRVLFEEANTLSDMELLRQAQRVSSEMTERQNTNTPVGRAMYDQLQTALAKASFVSQRNLTLQSEEHRGANTIISHLKAQLQRVCVAIYSERFCELKRLHPHWKDTVILSITAQEVLYGMSPEQVEAAWGRASRISKERGGYRHCYGSSCERSVWIYEGRVRERGRAEEQRGHGEEEKEEKVKSESKSKSKSKPKQNRESKRRNR